MWAAAVTAGLREEHRADDQRQGRLRNQRLSAAARMDRRAGHRRPDLAAAGNTHFMLVNEMPHGELKQSGYGKDMSLYAQEDYTAVRHVMIAHG